MGKQWKQCQTLFWGGSKITADGDCSHEIKRRLLLGRKVMTNLDSMLKSRGITLSTKVHLVKAMVFPVVMYGCESDCEESWLKAQHSENEDRGIRSHHFMANRWGNSGNSDRLYFSGLQKSLQMVTAAMKPKDAYSLEGKL